MSSQSAGKPYVAAIVPIRSHSERIPGKNTRLFCGRPLYHWILETLQDCASITKIWIDTDSEHILNDAPRHFDVRTIPRPKSLCSDSESVNNLLRHDLTVAPGEIFLQTHCTNPLLRAETIEQAIAAFLASPESDSLFSVTRVRKRFYDSAGRAVNHDPSQLLRTQDISPLFEENSCIYLFRRDTIDRLGRRIGARPIRFEMDALEATDIDEESDFILAECLWRSTHSEVNLAP